MQYSQNTTQYGSPNSFEMSKMSQPQTEFSQVVTHPGVLIVPPPPIISQEHFKPYNTRCPNCHAQITTETTFHMGATVKMWVYVMLCIFGWFGLCCCAIIPCCVKGFKDVQHICPQCHRRVAEYKRHQITPQYQKPWLRSRAY